MAILKFPDWKPDLPDLATATTIALNVVPETVESYGPLASIMEYTSTALDGACLGAMATESEANVISVFAGTQDNLYQLVAGTTAWANVSDTPGGYDVVQGDTWHFETFGNSVFATDFSDPIQSFEQGTSTAFGPLLTAPLWAVSTNYMTVGQQVLTAAGNRYTLATAGISAGTGTGPSGVGLGIVDGGATWNYNSGPVPNARYMCTPKNFLMIGNTFDSVGGIGPNRIWWSASDDPTSWPAPGSAVAQSVQSDYNDFEGPFGAITGMADSLAGADVAVFFEHAVWRGVYVGPPDIFDFFPAENVRGTRCPNSIVVVGNLVYYAGEDGFYAFDGSSSDPIGVDKFDQWFWTNVNQGFLWNVIGAADPVRRAIFWIFPSTAASSGIPDTVLIYRWDLQRASYAQFSAQWLFRVLSFGVTLDSFSSLGFTDLDTIPYSLDSRVWVGGALSLGAIDANAKLAYFSGPALAAQIGTQTIQPTPGKLSWIDETRPLVDLSAGGPPTIALAGRNTLFNTTINFGADVPPDINGDCPQRLDARYVNGLLKIPAAAAWTHAIGIDANAAPSGDR